MRSHQRGLSGAFVAVILVLVAAVALAAVLLARTSLGVQRGGELAAHMRKLEDALTQYVSANGRLPCPANPAADDGAEVVGGAAGTCTHPEGTVPWLTIGARPEEGIDPWAQKISYRVYTGGAGSLTQDGGASMVQCDTFENSPTTASALSGSQGGLCRPGASVYDLKTTPANFLVGKGLHLNDNGTARADVAYVLVSHGPTGFGAYSTGGVRRDLPADGGGERYNTELGSNPLRPFTIRAFSASGTDPGTVGHFDDYVAYRRIEELIRLAGRYARNWPDTGNIIFDRPTLEAALGGSFTPNATTGSVGQVSVTFVGAVATGVANSTATDISFGTAGGHPGIGVAGGGNALIQSSANEFVSLQFSDTTNTKFAATLGDFGTYGGTFSEFVIFAFFSGGLGGTNVATKGGLGCNIDGGLASFSMDVGAAFDTVAIASAPAFESGTATFSGISAFLVSEVAACPSSAPTCVTSLANVGNTCPVL